MSSSRHIRSSSPLIHRDITLLMLVMDMIALLIAFYVSAIGAAWLAELLFDSQTVPPYSEALSERQYLYISISLATLIAFSSKGHYIQRIPWWSQVQYIAKVMVIALILDGFIYFIMQQPFSRLLISLNWAVAFFLILGARQLVWFIGCKRGIWQIPAILVGDRESIINALYAFSTDSYTGYNIRAILLRDKDFETFDQELLPKAYRNKVEIIDGRSNYEDYIKTHPDVFYMVALEAFRGEERDNMVRSLENINAEYAIVPPVSRSNLYGMDPHYFFGNDTMLLHAQDRIHSPLGRFIKRLMDIVVSGSVLLVLSPVFLVITVLMRLEGMGAPTFYGGQRLGMHGRLFNCWKFRSMVKDGDKVLQDYLANNPDAQKEWNRYHKLQYDPRVPSRTARFIRKVSLDELPQLWNVFVGDMSLVGPRPILGHEKEEYGETINKYLSVRPGITGLWQVSGRNHTSFEQRIYWDSWYVRNWSVWHDIVIIFKTVRVVLTGSGAY